MNQDAIRDIRNTWGGVYGPMDRNRLPIGTMVTYRNVFYGEDCITGWVRDGWLEPCFVGELYGPRQRAYYVSSVVHKGTSRQSFRDHVVTVDRIVEVHGPRYEKSIHKRVTDHVR